MKMKKIKKLSINQLWNQCSKSIRERDNNQCAMCGKTGLLHVHHILPKERYKELRFDKMNLITLCPSHHRFGKYSAHKNGLFFSEFLRLKRPIQYQYCMNKILDGLKESSMDYLSSLNNSKESLINSSDSSDVISISSK